MISGSEDRIDPYRPVEVTFGTPQVAKIVFRDASEKESPAVCRVQLSKYIEIVDGQGVLAVGQCIASAHEEHILVILGKSIRSSCSKEHDGHYETFQYSMHIKKKLLFSRHNLQR